MEISTSGDLPLVRLSADVRRPPAPGPGIVVLRKVEKKLRTNKLGQLEISFTIGVQDGRAWAWISEWTAKAYAEFIIAFGYERDEGRCLF